MTFTSFLLAASGIFALTHGAPISTSTTRSLAARDSSYSIFGGDGTAQTGWPSQNDWKSFDDLWEINLPVMKSSCSQFGVPNNSDQEISDIKEGVYAAAKNSGLPEEFIFAVLMQESKGCVRAPTTNWGVRNPGLMQDHDGEHTCNEGGVQNPCPKDQIFGMINDGASGTPQGDGLKQTLQQAGNDDTAKWYRAARIYNSGRVHESGNLGGGIATHCYASDIANRLLGWSSAGGSEKCKEGEIGSISTSEGFAGGNNGGNDNNKPTPTQTPVVKQPTQPEATATAVPQPTITVPKPGDATVGNDGEDKPADKPTESNNGESSSAPKAPGASSDCKKWHTVQSGDYCQKIEQAQGVAEGTLVKLNQGLNTNCNNLWLGYQYCVSN